MSQEKSMFDHKEVPFFPIGIIPLSTTSRNAGRLLLLHILINNFCHRLNSSYASGCFVISYYGFDLHFLEEIQIEYFSHKFVVLYHTTFKSSFQKVQSSIPPIFCLMIIELQKLYFLDPIPVIYMLFSIFFQFLAHLLIFLMLSIN